MNRLKKEELKKYQETRKNLNPEQIQALNAQEAEKKSIEELARHIHYERFPEEYDFYFDSTLEANLRNKGENPMRDDYIIQVTERRKKLGVSPLGNNGMSTSNDTWEICLEEAKNKFHSIQ